VTRVTIEPLVGSGERVLGLSRMIEAPASPAVGIVAKRAIGPQPTFVKLVLVATSARRACVLERGGAMALLAGHDRMAADQRKARQIVIEADRLVPVRSGCPADLCERRPSCDKRCRLSPACRDKDRRDGKRHT